MEEFSVYKRTKKKHKIVNTAKTEWSKTENDIFVSMKENTQVLSRVFDWYLSMCKNISKQILDIIYILLTLTMSTNLAGVENN